MRRAIKRVLLTVCVVVMCVILVSYSKQTEIADSTNKYRADMPLMASGEPTKIANCTRENVWDVGLLNGKTSVVAYYTKERGLISIVRKYYFDIGRKTEGPYDYVWYPTFSPDGKTLAYSAEIYGKCYVIAGEEKAGPYDSVVGLTFSPNGKTLAYRAEIDDKFKTYLLVDGTPYLGRICGGHAVYLKDGAIWTR